MIQRIQTVYLVLGALALAGTLLFDDLWQNAATAELTWLGPALLVLGGLAAAVALLSVFLYKNRKQQRTVVGWVQLLTLLFIALLGGGLWMAGAFPRVSGPEGDTTQLVGLLLPFVAYVFFYLARRGIQRDIHLIKSMDRLR